MTSTSERHRCMTCAAHVRQCCGALLAEDAERAPSLQMLIQPLLGNVYRAPNVTDRRWPPFASTAHGAAATDNVTLIKRTAGAEDAIDFTNQLEVLELVLGTWSDVL